MKIIGKTLFGLEEPLAQELTSLGAKGVKVINRAVSFSGDKKMLYKVNYCSRLALSFLSPIASFGIRSKDDLYDKSLEINWLEYMDVDKTFSISAVVNSPLFPHTGFPALVVKDAIVDTFRKRVGRRPSVDTFAPSVVINLHVSNDMVTISLDSTIVPLYKRGYREEQGIAPLNEVLAAGMLSLSGWEADKYLLDPMCGSGTLLIEAGLMATNTPPGRYRDFFGFQEWRDYDKDLFQRVKEEADGKIKEADVPILGSDISPEAVSMTISNIKSVGMQDYIVVNQSDVRNIRPKYDTGFLVTNPPYGQRINPDDINELYAAFGSVLKHNFPGHKAWVITSEASLLHNIGLRPKAKYKLFNGALECLFVGYELYEGSKKNKIS